MTFQWEDLQTEILRLSASLSLSCPINVSENKSQAASAYLHLGKALPS